MDKTKTIIKCIQSFPKILFWKIKYGKRLNINILQNLGPGMDLIIGKSGSLDISKGMTARRNCMILCDNGKIKVGKNLFMNNNVSITCEKSITIGNNCTIANNVVIVDHDHAYKSKNSAFICEDIVIGNDVWLGANAVVLRGTHIGDGCVVAAGTIVKGDYKSNMLIYNKKETILKPIFFKS